MARVSWQRDDAALRGRAEGVKWRTRDFFAVLNEHAGTPEANRTAGLLYRLLVSNKHIRVRRSVSGNDLDFSIDRAATAEGPQIDAYDATRRSLACRSGCRR